MFVFPASPWTNLDINLYINMYIPPNSFGAKTPECQPCGVGTEKVSIWKPWMFANPSDVSMFLFLSGADKSHQDLSFGHQGYQYWNSRQSLERPLKKKIFYQNKMFDSEWRQMKRLRITKCGRNHCKSSHQGLKMLRVRLFQGTDNAIFWRFIGKLKS